MAMLSRPHDDALNAHGRRRRAVDRPGAVHDGKARLPEPRRRHVLQHSGLLAIRAAAVGRRQHHLQDPLQRCGGDDGRPAGRGHPDVAEIARQVAAEGARQSSSSPTSPASIPADAGFAAGVEIRHRDELDRGAARAARNSGPHGARSTTRPARRRSAGAASAARCPIRRSASSSTKRSARAAATAREKSNCISVRAARDRVRTQAHDRPVELQQGLLLHRRVLPELRHRARRHDCAESKPCRGARRRSVCRICRCRRRAHWSRRTAS